ncbi:MAG: hypothetical protein IKN48_10665 [Bacteroidaceae bacterium]|nr:hypothetical protein [Bacteroidaceae bacterium]
MTKLFLWILLFVAVVAPILVYILFFKDLSISHDPNDWGIFGDYIGGVYSVILTIVLVYITRFLNKKDEKKSRKDDAIYKIYTRITALEKGGYKKIQDIDNLLIFIESNKLILREDIYLSLIDITDYFKSISDKSPQEDYTKVSRLKNKLKQYYEE